MNSPIVVSQKSLLKESIKNVDFGSTTVLRDEKSRNNLAKPTYTQNAYKKRLNSNISMGGGRYATHSKVQESQ